VTARIWFYDETWSNIELEFFGQWAITKEREHVGWTEMKPAIDVPTGHVWAKLQLAIETDIWTEVIENGIVKLNSRLIYGLCGENLHERPLTGDHVFYRITENSKRLRVNLMGINMPPKTFEFNVDRLPDGGIKSITSIGESS
jgi:hypothetical protein